MRVEYIEQLILKGENSLLRKIKGLIIEVNDNFREQTEIDGILLRGRRLLGKQTLLSHL